MNASAGWYADPDGAPLQRYWSGADWTSHTRPAADYGTGMPSAEANIRDQISLVAGVLAIVLAAVGLICNFQSVSLVSGAGIVWVGSALTISAAIFALAVPNVRTWIKFVTVIVAIVGVANGVYVNHQLDVRRQQIQQIFNQLP
jgi:hypothetical protein